MTIREWWRIQSTKIGKKFRRRKMTLSSGRPCRR
jgi:hypothetical protein